MRVLGHLPRTPTGGSVDYATNEVRHFRTCPSGGDLIVAHDIAIDTSKTPYFTSGGVLVHIVNYRAPKEDLQAIRYLGRVPSVS
jgi:hypothetical protein